MYSYSGDLNIITGKPNVCECGLCFKAPIWQENLSRCDTEPTTDHLSSQILSTYEEKRQKDETKWAKESFRRDLEDIMRKQTLGLNNPQVVINGSTKYQMALDDSDLDLCIATSDLCTYNKKSILSSLGNILREKGLIQSVPIIHGKQRVVMKCKAGSADRKFRVDIQIMDAGYTNINHKEPIITTNILAYLATVDKRFPILATIVKLWAKKNNIHDASDWRLSSYAIVLLLVQYLQIGCNPPILPLVQSNTTNDIIDMIENKYFCSANRQTLGDLLVGFFRFYAEQFSFEKQFVSVNRAGYRCRCHLPAYSDNYIYVEDPFTKKNAAQCVKFRDMFQRIKTVFQTSYASLSGYRDLHLVL